MKLLPAFADPSTSQTRAKTGSASGQAGLGDDPSAFHDILSDVGTKTKEAATSSKDVSQAVTGPDPDTAVIAQGGSDETSTLLDRLMTGIRQVAAEPAGQQAEDNAATPTQGDDRTVDRLLKRAAKRADDEPPVASDLASLAEPAAAALVGLPTAMIPTPVQAASSAGAPALALPGAATKSIAQASQEPQAPEMVAAAPPAVFGMSVATHFVPAVSTPAVTLDASASDHTGSDEVASSVAAPVETGDAPPLRAQLAVAADAGDAAPTTGAPPAAFDLAAAARIASTPSQQSAPPPASARNTPPTGTPAAADLVSTDKPSDFGDNLVGQRPARGALDLPTQASHDDLTANSATEAIVASAGVPLARNTSQAPDRSLPIESSRPATTGLAGASGAAIPPPEPESARSGSNGGSQHTSQQGRDSLPHATVAAPTVFQRDEDVASASAPNSTPIATAATALPVLPPPVRQVADALARLAGDAAAPATVVQVPDVATPRPTLARTLTLQMSPAEFGTVSIKMHAAGGALDVQLTASDAQTAGLLSRERDALAASLQDQHTQLHSLVIQDGSVVAQPGGHHATQGETSDAQARAHRQGSNAGGDGDGRQRRERPDGQARRDGAADGGRRRPQPLPSGGTRRALLV